MCHLELGGAPLHVRQVASRDSCTQVLSHHPRLCRACPLLHFAMCLPPCRVPSWAMCGSPLTRLTLTRPIHRHRPVKVATIMSCSFYWCFQGFVFATVGCFERFFCMVFLKRMFIRVILLVFRNLAILIMFANLIKIYMGLLGCGTLNWAGTCNNLVYFRLGMIYLFVFIGEHMQSMFLCMWMILLLSDPFLM
jgi:hypothetical protein